MQFENLVKTTYSPNDVILLMQDIRGKVPVLDTEEREKLIQSGVHYSEMLPLEYVPTEKYMEIYQKSLDELSYDTACAVAMLAEKIYKKHGKDTVIVSLARAGTPIGILLKRYFKYKYGIIVPHYSISIIRGKGIDIKAMDMIVSEHGSEHIQFLDGWVGKGAINNVLEEACEDLKKRDEKFGKLSSELAVLTDPACVTELYGTRQDFLIPSACLNATVTGLVSRTVKLKTMTDEELHGAVFYGGQQDFSYDFIEQVEKDFPNVRADHFSPSAAEQDESFKGIDEIKKIAEIYQISDLNKIKPGVGETTRVLLRRVPYKVLVNPAADKKYLQHILQLCDEKQIPVEEYPFEKYNVCGIIKTVADC